MEGQQLELFKGYDIQTQTPIGANEPPKEIPAGQADRS